VGQLWDTPAGTEVPIGRHLELLEMQPRLQIPGLAGLSQGPGFANLGALGLLANRVLQPLLKERAAARATDHASAST
jgi:mycobactin lysine-N-oxygenase